MALPPGRLADAAVPPSRGKAAEAGGIVRTGTGGARRGTACRSAGLASRGRKAVAGPDGASAAAPEGRRDPAVEIHRRLELSRPGGASGNQRKRGRNAPAPGAGPPAERTDRLECHGRTIMSSDSQTAGPIDERLLDRLVDGELDAA